MGASSSTNKAAPPDEKKIDPIPSISMSDSPSQPQSDEASAGECGFCLFMKGGRCKESFVVWEECIEQAEKTNEDIALKCFDVTSTLRTCMLAHPDYYEPVLRAERAAEEEAIKETAADNTMVVIELDNQKAAAATLEEKQ